MVETQLCKLRGRTSDTFVGRAYSIPRSFIYSMFFVNQTYDMITNTQFYKKISFARVLRFILMKDIGR